MKVLVLSLMLVGYVNVVSGLQRSDNKSNLTAVPKRGHQLPSVAPKKVLLNNDFIKVNSRDTIFVQTIQFPLMSDAEKVFVGKKITDYRSSKIKLFVDSFYARDKVDESYFQNVSYSQRWVFEVVYQSQTEFSFKLKNYEFTGGAHGNTSVKSFNLDLKNLKNYKLNEKFPDLSLEKVAQYCTNYCIRKDIPIFDNMIKPNPELFNVWNFTNEGLLLTFQQYSVAPYSSGIIEIHIPNKEIDNLMND